RSTDGVHFTQVGTSAAETTFFADTSSLAPSTKYFYQVIATNPLGDAAASNTATATTPSGAPLAPTNLTVTATKTHVILAWSPSTSATSYNVYRGTSSGGEGTTAYQTGLTSTSFTDTAVTPGTN